MRTYYERGVTIKAQRRGASSPAGNSPPMPLLSTPLLARACRIYLDTAYPGGAPTIPENKRVYARVAADEPVQRYLTPAPIAQGRSEEHTSELQSHSDLVCRLLLEKNNNAITTGMPR